MAPPPPPADAKGAEKSPAAKTGPIAVPIGLPETAAGKGSSDQGPSIAGGHGPVTIGLPEPAAGKGSSDQGTPIAVGHGPATIALPPPALGKGSSNQGPQISGGHGPVKPPGGKPKGKTYEDFKAKYDALTPEEKEKRDRLLFDDLKGCGELRCKLRKYIAELLKNKDAPLKPADVAAKLKKYSETCYKKGKDGKAPEKEPSTHPPPSPVTPTPPAIPTPYLAPPAVPQTAPSHQNLPAPDSPPAAAADSKGPDAKAIVA